MNNFKRNTRVKGFTLMELIIVIAIIGILVGILGPTMTSYYRASRIKECNADAKMVFNAGQTVAQSFAGADRILNDSEKSPFAANTVIISYSADTKNVTWGTVFGTMGALDKTTADGKAVDKFVNYVNKTVSDGAEKNWVVVVDGYIVTASASANSPSSNIIGYYSCNNASGGRTLATEAFKGGITYSSFITGGASSDGISSLQDLHHVYKPADPNEGE